MNSGCINLINKSRLREIILTKLINKSRLRIVAPKKKSRLRIINLAKS